MSFWPHYRENPAFASHDFAMKIMEIPIYIYFSCKVYFGLSAGLFCDFYSERKKNSSFLYFTWMSVILKLCVEKIKVGWRRKEKNEKRIQNMKTKIKKFHPPMEKIWILYGTWQKRGWWKILYSMLRTTSNEMELFVLNQCGDSA